jgi:coenzyme F420-reducing hydrogenase beta subunit
LVERAPAEIAAAGLCIGCGACGGPMRWTPHLLREATGPQSSATVAAICPFSPEAANEDTIAVAAFPAAASHDPHLGRIEANYVGHVAEGEWRAGGSSGGMVSWVAAELLRTGAIDGVLHVVPTPPENGGFFAYRISRTLDEIAAGARSRYHPVDMAAVLEEVRCTPGRYAVVGIPCFIKAVNLLRRAEPVMAERIVATLGLFCGHMKSRRFVDSFAWQLGAEPDEVRAVEYRRKDAGRPANWYTAHLTLADGSTRQQDWWHLADGDWGAGYFQAGACDYCDDVVAETADISFGDAWVEPYSSDGRGTNVVVVRSPVVARMIAGAIGDGRLALEPVDAEFVRETQAAGFRHRREGLAWRLAMFPPRLPLRKRVAPAVAQVSRRRRLVYRTRRHIARWSHKVARLARVIGAPGLYIRWARAMLGLYQGLAYDRGRWGAAFKRLGL